MISGFPDVSITPKIRFLGFIVYWFRNLLVKMSLVFKVSKTQEFHFMFFERYWFHTTRFPFHALIRYWSHIQILQENWHESAWVSGARLSKYFCKCSVSDLWYFQQSHVKKNRFFLGWFTVSCLRNFTRLKKRKFLFCWPANYWLINGKLLAN